jgi:ABC-type uncharacterized transport system permease subunit
MAPLGTVTVAMVAGVLRVSTRFLFVSLGECLTERSCRINLGSEGVLVLGAMVAYATSYEIGSPWLGVLAAAVAGALLGAVHGGVCSLARVNDVAIGIAIMLAGTGIAFCFGKPYVQPSAAQLPRTPLGFWASAPQMRSALEVSPLFFVGLAAAFALHCFFRATRMGLRVRIVGDSADAARALGLAIDRVRLLATAAGSALAGIARQTEKIVAMVGKAKRGIAALDLVVFTEYALHGLSMDTRVGILCECDGPEVAAFRGACRTHRVWRFFSIMELNPTGNPWNSGLIIDDAGVVQLYDR